MDDESRGGLEEKEATRAVHLLSSLVDVQRRDLRDVLLDERIVWNASRQIEPLQTQKARHRRSCDCWSSAVEMLDCQHCQRHPSEWMEAEVYARWAWRAISCDDCDGTQATDNLWRID